MHKPKQPTQKINIQSFDEAMKSYNSSSGFDKEKWICVPAEYSEYRYILGTKGRHPLITIGINPSTAQPEDLDRTLTRVQNIAKDNNFDSFIMVNVYAQRATNPDEMDEEFNEKLHNENMEAFRWILNQVGNAPTIWLACGTLIEKRNYLQKCLNDMIKDGNAVGANWYIVGETTKKGHPPHPLYQKKGAKISSFDVAAYLKELEKRKKVKK